MSSIRVLVGTKKGAFILTSDGTRKDWKINGPHFAGWEMYHLKGSPVDPNRIYASQSSGWFGQVIQRSDDGGKTWNTPGSSAVLDAIEEKFSALRGTMRDHGTLKRRPFVRYFACQEDLSAAPPETLLPDAVQRGDAPLLIIGAMAGG